MTPKHLSDEILTRYLEGLAARMESGLPFELREIELAARVSQNEFNAQLRRSIYEADHAQEEQRVPRLSDLSAETVKELRECLRDAHFKVRLG